MANEEHLQILGTGGFEAIEAWNKWRLDNPGVRPCLDGVHLPNAMLQRIDLSGADLRGAFLRGAHLYGANLSGADLSHAVLVGATLSAANLANANLSESNLAQCTMNERTEVEGAIFTGSRIYGMAAWGLKGDPAEQSNLLITLDDEPSITVDNIEVAQFVYMLLEHRKIGDVITTIGRKAVLILGRFTKERKAVLDAIAVRLRELGYLPMIFDFKKVPGQDYTHTIKVLAGLSRFVIADITQPKSIPQEAQAIVPDFKIPFVRIIQKGHSPWSMSEDFNLYDWVVDSVIEYPNRKLLIENLANVVGLAESKHDQLMRKKAKETLKILSIDDIGEKQQSPSGPF
jgi:hypothetical protein